MQDIDTSGSSTNEPAAGSPEYELVNLRREGQTQARQIAELQNTINQLMSQLMATPNEKRPISKPKIATPEKFDGSHSDLWTFLTSVELFCEYHETPTDQEKILVTSTYMKGKAARWMQPYVKDFLKDAQAKGTKDETKELFDSWDNFKKELGRIFGEIDEKKQAERAITRLRQTKSVSSYTAEFKQLQARIDWNDASLRTAFEAGLKENVKDGLVHHDEPETLHDLIELATRIDHRLWERSEQRKKHFQPNGANTKRYRSNKDTDGDTIMTGKVQEKSKDKRNRARGTNHDGISKEERQKRYDSKACLRCGEVGHFRRDCPKNEVKQAVVKISMLRARTPYPEPLLLSEDEVSDLDLYDEARLLDQETYEEVPPPREAKVMIDYPKESDPKIDGATVRSRLIEGCCWVCGDQRHHADECQHQDRVVITGPKAEEIAYEAIHQQPYFKDLEAEVEDQEATPRKRVQHKDMLWTECKRKRCDPHNHGKYISQTNAHDHCHIYIRDDECLDDHCRSHQRYKEERAHQELCWFKCEPMCQYHKGQRRDALQEDNYYHSTITAEECQSITCPIHSARDQTDGKRVPLIAQGKEKGKQIPHEYTHWTFCYNDSCRTHYDAKYGSGYFPKERKKSQKGRLPKPKN